MKRWYLYANIGQIDFKIKDNTMCTVRCYKIREGLIHHVYIPF